MKNAIISIIILTTIASCAPSVKEIGKINMISNRNIDTKLDYEVISTYSGGSKKELKKSKAANIEDAIDKTVRKVPGGEFLMNVKIYAVGKNKYFAVEGDVWGVKANIAYRGFKVGDKVTWKTITGYKTGTIKSLKDDKTCLIETEGGNTVEKRYDEISKIQ